MITSDFVIWQHYSTYGAEFYATGFKTESAITVQHMSRSHGIPTSKPCQLFSDYAGITSITQLLNLLWRRNMYGKSSVNELVTYNKWTTKSHKNMHVVIKKYVFGTNAISKSYSKLCFVTAKTFSKTIFLITEYFHEKVYSIYGDSILSR